MTRIWRDFSSFEDFRIGLLPNNMETRVETPYLADLVDVSVSRLVSHCKVSTAPIVCRRGPRRLSMVIKLDPYEPDALTHDKQMVLHALPHTRQDMIAISLGLPDLVK